MAKKSASDIRAGRAFVELFADDSALQRGLKAAQRRLQAFGAAVQSIGRKFMGIGGMIVSPLVGAAKVFDSMGSGLYDMSQRTGASVEALSVLGYAARQTGTDMEAVEAGLRRMQKTVADAAAGSSSAQEALQKLGLTAKDLAGLSPEEQFARIADALAAVEDPSARAAAAMKVLGRGGAALLPLMAGGAAGLDQYRKAAERLGLVISTTDARAADEFGDTLSDLWATLKGVAFTVGSAVAPVLKDAAGWLIQAAVTTSAWIKENRGLIASALKVGAVIFAAGAAVYAAGAIFKGLAIGIGIAISAIKVLYITLAAGRVALLALVSPIGAIATLALGIGAAFLYSSGGVDAAMNAISDSLRQTVAESKRAFGAIAKALSAGDIAKAAEILWLLMKLEWTKGVGALQDIWGTVWTKVKLTANDAWTGLMVIWENMVHEMTKLLINASTLWDKAIAHTKGFLADLKTGSKQIGQEIAINMNPTLSSEEKDRRIQAVRLAASPEWEKTDAERRAALKAADDRNAAMLQGVQEIHDREMKNILAEGDARDASYKSDLENRKKAIDAELAAARANFNTVVGDVEAQPDRRPSLDPQDWVKKFKDVTASLATDLKGVSSVGTFNAAATFGLAGSAADRTAAATEGIRDLTKKGNKLLEQIAEDGEAEFT